MVDYDGEKNAKSSECEEGSGKIRVAGGFGSFLIFEPLKYLLPYWIPYPNKWGS
jgi:hypothetical protein